MDHKLSRLALLLGVSGLIPQMLALALTWHPPHAALAQFAGFLYAALIFSFIGGLWWGIAAANRAAPKWLFAVAVVPALIAFGASLIWVARTGSAGLSLRIVGTALVVSPLIDWWLGRAGLVPRGWLFMRLVLSFGLGALTLSMA